MFESEEKKTHLQSLPFSTQAQHTYATTTRLWWSHRWCRFVVHTRAVLTCWRDTRAGRKKRGKKKAVISYYMAQFIAPESHRIGMLARPGRPAWPTIVLIESCCSSLQLFFPFTHVSSILFFIHTSPFFQSFQVFCNPSDTIKKLCDIVERNFLELYHVTTYVNPSGTFCWHYIYHNSIVDRNRITLVIVEQLHLPITLYLVHQGAQR